MVRILRGPGSRLLVAVSSLVALGAFTVPTVAATADVTPPVMYFHTVGPSFLDTATDTQTASVTVEVTDDSSGVQAPVVLLQRSGTSQEIGPVQLSLVNGTDTDGSWSASFPFSPSDSTGTWNVTLYPLTDNAGNQAGPGDPSYYASIGSFDVEHYPQPAESVAATAHDQSAWVSWAVPYGSNTGYGDGSTCTATASPGGRTAQIACGSGQVIVDGLTNGVAYTFTVTRSDSTGSAPPSGPTGAITPSGFPRGPTHVAATPGDSQATVSWSGADGNGAPITGYVVHAYVVSAGSSDVGSWSVPPDATSFDVTGLTNGTNYGFGVSAVNVNGSSRASGTPAPSVIPSAPPTAPTHVVAVPGNGSATVRWDPAVATYSPVSDYSVTAFPGGRTYDLGRYPESFVVPDLTDGVTYAFTLSATDTYGRTVKAVSNAVMPVGPPGAPKFVSSVSGRSLTLKWGIAASNGSPVTKYAIRLNGRTYWFGPGVHVFRMKFMAPMRSQPALMAYNALGCGTVTYVKFWVH